ncbi:MAG TPA: triose-phosphate isomerase [Candidatus Saccharimonadales bacterium]|nr:triose-phosphate isomerase [Candidatus Saccharimonadales bacterium]
MRKKLIVGNWKMHLTVQQASLLVHRLNEQIKVERSVEVVLAPSMLALQPLSLEIDRRKFRLASQDAFDVDEGAYTGEVSFAMLRDLVEYAIVGHSERRRYFHEDLPMVRAKVAACVRNDITPILCIGETKREHEAHETKQVIHDQLTTAIADLTGNEIESLVVAYEPVWAISSGTDFAHHEIATPDEVADVAAFIRHNVSELYGARAAGSMRVIYGGSSDAENATSYLSVSGIDGLLPGGASLNYVEFSGMVAAAERLQHAEAKAGSKS